jgi:Carbohydrate esterase, sialic acid-specific acetylesterase
MDHLDAIKHINYNDTIFRQTLWNDTGSSYNKRSDVYMKYGIFGNAGHLTCHQQSGFAFNGRFGPELMFGYTIGDYFLSRQQPKHKLDRPNILLLKVAWGGRSLAVDFRPPSSGIGNYSSINASDYGLYYRKLIQDVRLLLNSISTYVPSYRNSTNTSSVAYELKGFIWFQGWSDIHDNQMVQEYQTNLENFIRDVRKDLNSPILPFGTLLKSGNIKQRSETTHSSNIYFSSLCYVSLGIYL